MCSSLEFTNVGCESLDTNFSAFEYCVLKSVNRTYKYLSLKVNLFKIPINAIKINFAMYKRLNGYKPFLYNVTVDACRYFKNPKSNPVATYFYNSFKDFSNMNHSCPYDHDLVVHNVSANYLSNHFSRILPFPEGSYMLKMHWYAYNINRAEFKLFFSLP
ncbi:hypothetical protein KR018_004637 [Drosophila ironensis]|nr:hypothetical protein KR018_004637 [Drosophila ironensis]